MPPINAKQINGMNAYTATCDEAGIFLATANMTKGKSISISSIQSNCPYEQSQNLLLADIA